MTPREESEWKTRKLRIDPHLDALGWARIDSVSESKPHRTEEHATDNGPADYALWLDRRVVGLIEAKRVTLGPQNVLTQAERYARGLGGSSFNFGGLRAPFLYSTNGEVVWFHDVRHPLNRSRRVAEVHTPAALAEMLGHDFDAECQRLTAIPHDHPRLRPYQKDANAAIEKAIADRKRNLLVAMATGTGKTYTCVNQAYRLMKSGVARRVLFLVDRRALAAQAVRAFASFEVEPGKKFDQVYEVYSSRFQTEDFGDDEKFDPKVLPQGYLTAPKPGHAFVYVCTIQRMAINLLGRQAIFGLGEELIEDDAERLGHPDPRLRRDHRGRVPPRLHVAGGALGARRLITSTRSRSASPRRRRAHTTAYFTHLGLRLQLRAGRARGHLVDYDVLSIALRRARRGCS
jgi:type I restriction enzyme R subunit